MSDFDSLLLEMNGAGTQSSYALPFTYFKPNGNNGRIDLSAPAGASSFDTTSNSAIPGFGYQQSSENDFQGDMLRGNWEHNALSAAFFSRRNVDIIQNLIRKEVFNRSQPKGYIIDNQSVDELKIIMRSLYLQYARNSPHNIPGQVQELNQRVVDWSVPHILSAVDHYQYYLKDIQTLPTPLPRSVHMSRAGTKSSPLDPFM